MKLTGEEVIEVIEQHKLTIERDHSLSQKVKNQQAVAIEAALLRVKIADREKEAGQTLSDEDRNK